MAPARFAVVLRERIGQDGYEALEELIQVRQSNLLTVDRFEQRLGEELGKLRSESSALRADLRGEMSALRSDVRGEISALRSEFKADIGALRSEFKSEISALRSELHGDMGTLRSQLQGDIGTVQSDLGALRSDVHKLGAEIRVEIAQRSSELLKWAMVFWVAQAAAVAGIVTALR